MLISRKLGVWIALNDGLDEGAKQGDPGDQGAEGHAMAPFDLATMTLSDYEIKMDQAYPPPHVRPNPNQRAIKARVRYNPWTNLL
jgi:hypothetical protein